MRAEIAATIVVLQREVERLTLLLENEPISIDTPAGAPRRLVTMKTTCCEMGKSERQIRRYIARHGLANLNNRSQWIVDVEALAAAVLADRKVGRAE